MRDSPPAGLFIHYTPLATRCQMGKLPPGKPQVGLPVFIGKGKYCIDTRGIGRKCFPKSHFPAFVYRRGGQCDGDYSFGTGRVALRERSARYDGFHTRSHQFDPPPRTVLFHNPGGRPRLVIKRARRPPQFRPAPPAAGRSGFIRTGTANGR